ncbi:MAG: HAD-IA family hydrolase, partial [Burkholderiales bacterium]|nr:HAD-IA family hydrolase [Burkholderiales bacterium]
LFDVCFASFRTGLMKPDARAFRHALEALGAEPARVWFFDDLAENVAAARALGIRAHRVQGLEALIAKLRAEGLYDPGPQGGDKRR